MPIPDDDGGIVGAGAFPNFAELFPPCCVNFVGSHDRPCDLAVPKNGAEHSRGNMLITFPS